jgi:hypothetical protein
MYTLPSRRRLIRWCWGESILFLNYWWDATADNNLPIGTTSMPDLGPVWLEMLTFNKYRSTFVLFDKKFSILDLLGLIDSSRKLLIICADMYAISLHLVLHAFTAILMWWELNFNIHGSNRALFIHFPFLFSPSSRIGTASTPELEGAKRRHGMMARAGVLHGWHGLRRRPPPRDQARAGAIAVGGAFSAPRLSTDRRGCRGWRVLCPGIISVDLCPRIECEVSDSITREISIGAAGLRLQSPDASPPLQVSGALPLQISLEFSVMAHGELWCG